MTNLERWAYETLDRALAEAETGRVIPRKVWFENGRDRRTVASDDLDKTRREVADTLARPDVNQVLFIVPRIRDGSSEAYCEAHSSDGTAVALACPYRKKRLAWVRTGPTQLLSPPPPLPEVLARFADLGFPEFVAAYGTVDPLRHMMSPGHPTRLFLPSHRRHIMVKSFGDLDSTMASAVQLAGEARDCDYFMAIFENADRITVAAWDLISRERVAFSMPVTKPRIGTLRASGHPLQMAPPPPISARDTADAVDRDPEAHIAEEPADGESPLAASSDGTTKIGFDADEQDPPEELGHLTQSTTMPPHLAEKQSGGSNGSHASVSASETRPGQATGSEPNETHGGLSATDLEPAPDEELPENIDAADFVGHPVEVESATAPGLIGRAAALLCAVLTVALTVWGVMTVSTTAVKAEAFLVADGWKALERGDYRLAGAMFGQSMDESVSSAPIVGLVCASWLAGYQDSALLHHQIYLGTRTRTLPQDNGCLGDLASWGIDAAEVDTETLLYPAATNAEERVFELVVTDVSGPVHYRYAGMACLSHARDLRLLAGFHLQSFFAEVNLADRDGKQLEPLPPELGACFDDMLPDYRESNGAIAPVDAPDRFFIGNYSPVPADTLPLPAPFPIGPDGELIDSLEVSS